MRKIPKVTKLLVVLLAAATGAWAQELSETFATNQELATYTGEHFQITITDGGIGDENGIWLDATPEPEWNGTAVITALGGENITRVELTVSYFPNKKGLPAVSSGTATASDDGYFITISDVNAATLTMTEGTANMQVKAIMVYYDYPAPPTPELILNDAEDNAAKLAEYDGQVVNVTLGGRTVYKDGSWNTLTLPFDLPLSGSPFDGAVARRLTASSVSGKTLNLTFSDPEETLQAGTPYIIRWTVSDEQEENFAIVPNQTSHTGDHFTITHEKSVNNFGFRLVGGMKGNTAVITAKDGEMISKVVLSVSDMSPTYPASTTSSAGVVELSDDERTITISGINAHTLTVANDLYIYVHNVVVYYTTGGGEDLTETDLVFNEVTIKNEVNDAATEAVAFRGLFSPFAIDGEDNTKLFMGSHSTLYYPNAAMTIGACRAYFQLVDGLTMGEPTDPQANIASFVFRFGNGNTTGINTINNEQLTINNSGWFTLDGQRLNGQPAAKGIYIHDGKKIIIK